MVFLKNFYKLWWLSMLVLVLPAVSLAQTEPPQTPSGLSYTGTSSSITLYWNDVANETSYKIEREVQGSMSWSVIANTVQDRTYYEDKTVSAGGYYNYKLYACNGTLCSQPAYYTSVQAGSSGTSTSCTGFIVTTNKTSYITGEDLSWTWSCASGVVTTWAIELVKPDNSVWPYTNGVFTAGQSSYSGSFSTSNLVVGSYTLRACFIVGCPTVNASTNFTIASSSGDGSLIAPYLTVTTTGLQAYLNWTDPTVNSEVGFKIFRRYAGTSWPSTPIYSQPPNSTNYTDTVQTAGGYEYKVQVYTNTASQDSNTVAVSLSSGGSNNPAGIQPPSELNYTTNGSTVNLSWPGVSDYFYNVQRRTDSSGESLWSNICSNISGSFTCTDSQVPNGTYKYRVQACKDTTDCSSWTESSLVTVVQGSSTIPPPPYNLSVASVSSYSIKIKWDYAGSISINKFKILRKYAAADNWSTLGETTPSVKEFSDNSVTAGTTYWYSVSACTSVTCSEYSSSISITASSSNQDKVTVTLKLQNNTSVNYGVVNFIRNGITEAAVFENTATANINLMPGQYYLQPSFPGVNNENILLSGQGINNRTLNLTSTGAEILISLPIRLPVKFLIKNSNGQLLSGANVIAHIPGTTIYTSAMTDSAGSAWLQLPVGTYQGKVIKAGFTTQTTAWNITDSTKEFLITLEILPIKVTGKVLVGVTPKANALVRAYNTEDNYTVVTNTDSSGYYSIFLRDGTWGLSALAEGYEEGTKLFITLNNTDQTKDLALGSAKQLISSSANIVPTVSVTVTADDLGVALGLPANSLGGGTQATITIRESTRGVATQLAAPLPRTVRDISASSDGQNIINLAASASVELRYTDNDLTTLGVNNANTASLKVAYWNETNNDWQVLASVVDTVNRKVIAATNHFTLFAIVLPFLAQPASAEEITSENEGAVNERATQLETIIAEGTKVYVSCSECLAASVNKKRDESLEQQYDKDIVSRVVGIDSITAGARAIIVNFVTYGTVTTIPLGAGERGGVVASFRAAYGHLPNSETEWQDVLKIANGRWPGVLLPDREESMKAIFNKIYLREAVVTNQNDSAALSIMAYGLRSAKRNLTSELAASTSFRAIYDHAPASASDWDAVRAIAYSGAKR